MRSRRGRVREPEAERRDRQLDRQCLCGCDDDGVRASRGDDVEPRVGDEQCCGCDGRAIEPGCATERRDPRQAEYDREPGVEAGPGDAPVP